jgi:hypothetical protein
MTLVNVYSCTTWLHELVSGVQPKIQAIHPF